MAKSINDPVLTNAGGAHLSACVPAVAHPQIARLNLADPVRQRRRPGEGEVGRHNGRAEHQAEPKQYRLPP